jgi:mRNA interferase RelE/StbE
VNSALKLIYHKDAAKFIAKQELAVQQRIQAALEELQQIPPVGDILKLKGKKDMFRLRIGTYRAVYQIDFQEKAVYILAIDNRGDIY